VGRGETDRSAGLIKDEYETQAGRSDRALQDGYDREYTD
jgi:hypothetical protein